MKSKEQIEVKLEELNVIASGIGSSVIENIERADHQVDILEWVLDYDQASYPSRPPN